MQFFIGWKIYGEPMTTVRLLSFALIWAAIGLYALDAFRRLGNQGQAVLAEDGAAG